MEALFACHKDDRSLSFEKISQICALGLNEVELVMMKAMGLNLIRGVIDEVDQVVHIDWIMPKYLTKEHMTLMSSRLGDWEEKMKQVVGMLENNSAELLA